MNNNRRGFLKGIVGALAGFAILPPATTYHRIWRAVAAEPEPEVAAGVEGIYVQVMVEDGAPCVPFACAFSPPTSLDRARVEISRFEATPVGEFCKRFRVQYVATLTDGAQAWSKKASIEQVKWNLGPGTEMTLGKEPGIETVVEFEGSDIDKIIKSKC